MISVIFRGKKHKISTDGKSFFLYVISESKELLGKWCLLSENKVEKSMFEEVLEDIKSIVSMDMPEDEKIFRICESGFFKI